VRLRLARHSFPTRRSSDLILEDLIERFPGSVGVADALYTIGWANFRQRKFDAADVAFNQLIKAYPSSAYVAEAQLRRGDAFFIRSEEHTSELQSRENLVCR